MKLNHQIISLVFLITSLAWFIFGLILIHWNFSEHINNKIQTLIQEDGYLRKRLLFEADYNKKKITAKQVYLKFSINQFAVEIYSENKELLLPKSRIYNITDRKELSLPVSDYRKYILHREKGRPLIMISGWIRRPQALKNLHVISSYELSSVYAQQQNNTFRFFVLSLLSLGFIVVLLIFGLKISLKPLDRLLWAMKKIQKGQWTQAVPIQGPKDIQLLSRQFNQMNQDIEDHLNQISQYNIKQERFIAGFTHQLHTPLTNIIGYSDIIACRDLPNNRIQDYAELISMEGRRLRDLGKSLRQLILLNQSVSTSCVSSISLLQDLKIQSEKMFKDKGISFKHSVERCTLTLNRELMNCALTNLLENAVNASEKGSSISLILKSRVNHILIQIIDTGCGINPYYLNRIQEPFFSLNKEKIKSKGLGIGLYLTSEILKYHRASLTIQSKVNSGTVVEIKFHI